jgi:hypothetical protein
MFVIIFARCIRLAKCHASVRKKDKVLNFVFTELKEMLIFTEKYIENLIPNATEFFQRGSTSMSRNCNPRLLNAVLVYILRQRRLQCPTGAKM